VRKIRERESEKYREVAAVVESALALEQQAHAAEALGNIDTFAFEERSLREAALAALKEGSWPKRAPSPTSGHPRSASGC
jgi:hypothetical protein